MGEDVLTKFCGEGEEEFFNYSAVFASKNPHFSNCFERTVFDLTPPTFLLVFGIPYLIIKRKSYDSYIPISKLFIAKLIFCFILCLMAWLDFGRGLYDLIHKIPIGWVEIISPFLVGLAMAKAAYYVHFDRLKGVRSSSLLSCYWILYVILWTFIFKSQVELLVGNKLTNRQLWRCVTFFISYACVLAQFVMCFFVDGPSALPNSDPYDEKTETQHESGQRETTAVKKDKLKPCPESSASFLSRTFFEWFSGMIWTGYKRPIVEEDLCDLVREDKAGRVSRHFFHVWNKAKERYNESLEGVCDGDVHNTPLSSQSNENSINLPVDTTDEDVLIEQPSKKKERGGPSLFKALCVVFGPSLIVSTLLKLLSDTLLFVSPQLLNGLIAFVTDATAPLWHGYVLAALLFIAAVFQSLVFQNHFHITFRIALRVRSAIVALVYRKSLVLSNTSRKESTVGEITNLMSVDAQRLMDLVPYLYAIISSPYQIFLALYFLWGYLGPSTLAGVGVMILLLPFNALIASKAYKYQSVQMTLKDDRIKLMNEILNGIKVLKMYAWEMSFMDKVNVIRKKELKVLRNFVVLNAAMIFTWTCAPFLVSLSTFAVYVLSDPSHVLDAQKVFVSISLFNILQFPLILLPVIISAIVQANVSMKRLQKFIVSEELDPESVDRVDRPGPVISIDNATFTWDKDGQPVLKDISMEVTRGKLVAVVGQVGCGKSSLLSSLLGDTVKVSGQVSVKGSIAYVAQQAWIQNLTVRDNILLGKPMDVCKYQDTVEACELKEDFEMLPAGGLTEIGERGINLSGGQKQRVSIARAVYHDSDVYLFDDPLSAVDAHVGKHIFDNVLGPNGSLRSKTRVLVTHSVAFLPQVDFIYVVVDGRISEAGNYDELLEKNGDFAEFLKNYARQDSDDEEDEDVDEDQLVVVEDAAGSPVVGSEESPLATAKQLQRQYSRSLSQKGRVRSRSRKKSEKERVCKLPDEKKTVDDKLMTEETAETGNIKASVVITYMKSMGLLLSCITFAGYVLHNVATVYSNIWLSKWTEDPVVNGTQLNTSFRLTIYGVLGLGNAIAVVTTAFAFSLGGVNASKLLHNKMLTNILKAPMSFFDTTPLGRIVNRFSEDMYLIDEVVPQSISSFLEDFFMAFSTIFVIIYSTPWFGVVIVPIFILYYFVQRFYVRTSRQLKRLESISRSPIYSHFSESLAGASTIRAYQLQKKFIKQNEEKVDTNQRAYFPNVTSNRWLGVRMEIVGNLIVLFAAIFAVLEKGGKNSIPPGVVGLSISYATQITMILNWMVRNASEAETNIVAVERVEEYANVKTEAPLTIDDQKPPTSWPDLGEIAFQDYSTRYREGLDLVVKGISLQINGGEKVGVVGRTGAGKSSLTLALFRIIEAAGGEIVIDGLDIGKMGLHSLRSKLSIIPQDPVLFSGTLRMNLDPFEAYTDEELWDALEHSHLKRFVSSQAKKLQHDISEGGDNLSVGQRQLVCLARALLRKSKILVLDEATAAIDLETDDLIQATIRKQFSDCTTFTIAHRLNTIMDSSRVLVMDAGKITEYDTPENLLQAKGIFYTMAKDAGLTS